MKNLFVPLCIAAFALCMTRVLVVSEEPVEPALDTAPHNSHGYATVAQEARLLYQSPSKFEGVSAKTVPVSDSDPLEAISDAVIPAGSRYALVIGNDAYPIKSLNNPINDALDTKAALERLGFRVDMVQNSNLSTMREAVSRLRDKLCQAEDSVGFFYYSGHGIQAEGAQYLIPSQALLTHESQLQEAALPVDLVLAELQSAGALLVIAVFDTGRANPFSDQLNDSENIEALLSQPPHTIIMYATGAGKDASDGKGNNGLFTGALLEHLLEPGLELKEVFKRTKAAVQQTSKNRQIPALYVQFFEPVYLAGKPADELPEEAPYYISQSAVSVLPVFDTDQIRSALKYPAQARTANIHGSVILELFIDSDGAIRQINVLQENPSGWGFAEAAVAALTSLPLQEPAQIEGVPVAVCYQYPVYFTLR
ncbi:MAG: caspase family protein [Spirochaetaceae bacterium]|jgi:TonB family protein|nr:caspase family protein [Spirochaetaceae bacterium]